MREELRQRLDVLLGRVDDRKARLGRNEARVVRRARPDDLALQLHLEPLLELELAFELKVPLEHGDALHAQPRDREIDDLALPAVGQEEGEAEMEAREGAGEVDGGPPVEWRAEYALYGRGVERPKLSISSHVWRESRVTLP